MLGFWLIRGSALGPIGGLSARQLNSCLPHIEDEDKETMLITIGTSSLWVNDWHNERWVSRGKMSTSHETKIDHKVTSGKISEELSAKF